VWCLERIEPPGLAFFAFRFTPQQSSDIEPTSGVEFCLARQSVDEYDLPLSSIKES